VIQTYFRQIFAELADSASENLESPKEKSEITCKNQAISDISPDFAEPKK
jgi:hypothetical protein